MQPTAVRTPRTYLLPPLILHPFSDTAGPNKLVESSRASLMLQGLLPTGDLSSDDIERTLLDGRFCEIRMLYYLGKDLARWIEQCLEIVEREEVLRGRGIRYQSIASLLIDDPPVAVRDKLRKWGVADYRSIFTRALGLNAVFSRAPERDTLTPGFVRNYYRFADHMFACRQHLEAFTEIRCSEFNFDLFASGEYTRMLEREWDADLPSEI